jgi:hypothetical protein
MRSKDPPANESRHHLDRVMPSLFIFHCKAERFMPSRASQHPVGFLQDAPDVLALGVFQRGRRFGRGGSGPGAVVVNRGRLGTDDLEQGRLVGGLRQGEPPSGQGSALSSAACQTQG